MHTSSCSVQSKFILVLSVHRNLSLSICALAYLKRLPFRGMYTKNASSTLSYQTLNILTMPSVTCGKIKLYVFGADLWVKFDCSHHPSPLLSWFCSWPATLGHTRTLLVFFNCLTLFIKVETDSWNLWAFCILPLNHDIEQLCFQVIWELFEAL